MKPQLLLMTWLSFWGVCVYCLTIPNVICAAIAGGIFLTCCYMLEV